MSPQVPKGPSIVQQELEWLDRLRAKLDPHIGPAVDTLVHLSKSSSRDQVREKAASKILSLFAQCAADSAKLKLQERSDVDEDENDNVRVVVVAREELGDVSQQLAASYQAKRAAARDVS
jgi:prephenate dehydratase